MIQVTKLNRAEKVAMYMKVDKRELVEMLLNNQRLVERLLAEKAAKATGALV